MDIITHKKIGLLIHLAMADGHIADSEKDFIYEIGEKKGFSKSDIDSMFKNPEGVGSLGALSLQTAQEYLLDMMFLMAADGIVHESEVIFCQQTGIKLGFQKSDVDEVILRVQMGKSEEQVKSFIKGLPHPSRS